jgi:hypothetical protein
VSPQAVSLYAELGLQPPSGFNAAKRQEVEGVGGEWHTIFCCRTRRLFGREYRSSYGDGRTVKSIELPCGQQTRQTAQATLLQKLTAAKK